MRVAIDVSQIVYGTGVSQYTLKLVEALSRIDDKNSYTLFGGSLRRKQDILNFFPDAKVFPIPPTLADFIWNRLHILPIEKLIGNIDVFHSSDWSQPPTTAFKVTTVHDLIPLKFPRLIHPGIVQVHKRRLAWVKKEVDMVIVPSDGTKLDLLAYGVDESRVRVVPESGILKKSGQAEIDAIKRKHKINGDYIVAFASAKYKNTERIVRAYELSSAGKNLKLVLVGRETMPSVKDDRNIRFTGYVDNNELSALITGSRGLVFTSLYEGFGQPILEGFTCEVPVVTSEISSMPEVAGDAAILVDPYSINSIADGIEKALRGPKSYVEKGLRRVKNFSWEKTAQMTLEVYNEAKSRPIYNGRKISKEN